MRYKFTPEALIDAASASTSFQGMLRLLGIKLAGGSHAHLKKKVQALNIDISHFTGRAWSKGRVINNKRKDIKTVLVVRPSYMGREKTTYLRRALLESGIEEKCSECGQGKVWNNKNLLIEIDHKDGNPQNNVLENLRFICPNCHSQTATYKNKRGYRSKVC